MNLCEFKGSLDYRISSKTPRATYGDPVSTKQNISGLSTCSIQMLVHFYSDQIFNYQHSPGLTEEGQTCGEPNGTSGYLPPESDPQDHMTEGER